MASYRQSDEELADFDHLYEQDILTFGLRQTYEYFDELLVRFQNIADQPEHYPTINHIH